GWRLSSALTSSSQWKERKLLNVGVAALGESRRDRGFADATLVREILARSDDAIDIELTREVRLDLSGRSRLATILQVFDNRREEQVRALSDVGINRVQRGVHGACGLLRIEHFAVDGVEELRIQCGRLRHDLAIGEQTAADDLDLRERRRGVQNPQCRVVEIRARDEPLVRLVNAGQRTGAAAEQPKLRIAIADC